MDDVVRCSWCTSDPLYIQYHDEEWGVPVYDDNKLFEMLTLEGAQAGLSWLTVLKKREGYRKAFANFDPKKVAQFTEQDAQRLQENPDIIRNRLKIASTIINAQKVLEIQKECRSLSHYFWSFVDHTPLQNKQKSLKNIPAKTEISDLISKDLKKRGFKFVGSTIIYAFMQAIGMVNDHTVDCFCHKKAE